MNLAVNAISTACDSYTGQYGFYALTLSSSAISIAMLAGMTLPKLRTRFAVRIWPALYHTLQLATTALISAHRCQYCARRSNRLSVPYADVHREFHD